MSALFQLQNKAGVATLIALNREQGKLAYRISSEATTSALTEEAQPPSPTAQTPGATPARSPEERLLTLKWLLDKGLNRSSGVQRAASRNLG